MLSGIKALQTFVFYFFPFYELNIFLCNIRPPSCFNGMHILFTSFYSLYFDWFMFQIQLQELALVDEQDMHAMWKISSVSCFKLCCFELCNNGSGIVLPNSIWLYIWVLKSSLIVSPDYISLIKRTFFHLMNSSYEWKKFLVFI